MKRKIHIFVIVELILISLLTMGNLIYTFQSLRYSVLSKLVIIAFCFFIAIIIVNFLFKKFSNRNWKVAFIILIVALINFGFAHANYFLYNYNVAMGRIQVAQKYSTTLIAKKDSKYDSVDDINSETTIGIQSIKFYENGQLALDELRELDQTDKIKQYSNLKEAFEALQKGEIDMMSSSGLSDEALLKLDSNLKNNYKEVVTFEVEEKVEAVQKDITNTPFTILISGIDSRSTDITDISNSDSNILVSFNPNTGRVTTLSTPRDSYVQIQCGGFGYDKLTHAAAYGGTKCVKETLEKLYEVEVDYTIRINFVGVIEIVDALGGIEVDVPINKMNEGVGEICEQDSHGRRNAYCWTEGEVNTFDGETALAFARNRYNQDGGDLSRGQNQQIVIEAILKKATSVNNIDTINKLLTTISNHMSTNINTRDIISLYEILVSMNNSIDIEKLYIGGATGMVGPMSVVYPNPDDIKYATYRIDVATEEVKPQFPTNGYYVLGKRPSNDDGMNPLRTQRMPFNQYTAPVGY